MSSPADYGDSTRSVHAGLPEAALPGQPFLPGPVFAAPYHLDPVAGPQAGVDGYGRPDNATRRALETAIGELEGGECVTFASGMAAVSAALLTQARPGDAVLLPADGYFLTRSFAQESLPGVTILLAPTAGPYPSFEGVRLVLLETPANPGLDVCDIASLASRAHAAGALLAVDNTTPTPLGQRPLELGADLVVASASKALTGHSDLILGYACTADPELAARLRAWRSGTGGVPGPFEAWLAHRSLGTLDLRLARQSENAAAIADLLAGRPQVSSVRWPGRPGDPSYEIASRQMRRIPGIVTFTLPSKAHVDAFLTASRLIAAATSFGGLHTSADRRAQWGDDAPEGLVRLSCGVEDTRDLVADITAALDAAAVVPGT
ncbi:cystathionine gamma-lyase [Planosporangium mesophilum]|uniref:Putative cystathionine gamma-lyase n=1 Tax=Planosporangium mesophilum TaxID=689768 RepID=A0A8J3T7D3_9ACTN|nr:cystathionine gamma-lyase [Planosporangium mesophilum]NJC81637.1 cystathionine gamma-lyase [Planosporangium mesophilum]GII20702.1 putative cystathionine gamma-lyase [Planosporangium mesophilum]